MIIKEDITLRQLAELTAFLASEDVLIRPPAKAGVSNAENLVCENFEGGYRPLWVDEFPFATLQRAATHEDATKVTVTLKVVLSYGVRMHPNNLRYGDQNEQQVVRTDDTYFIKLIHILQPVRG